MSIGLVLRPMGLPYKRHFYSVIQANKFYAQVLYLSEFELLDICCIYIYLFSKISCSGCLMHSLIRGVLMYINKVGLWMIKYIFSSGSVTLYKNCSDLTAASAVPLFRCWKKFKKKRFKHGYYIVLLLEWIF